MSVLKWIGWIVVVLGIGTILWIFLWMIRGAIYWQKKTDELEKEDQ